MNRQPEADFRRAAHPRQQPEERHQDEQHGERARRVETRRRWDVPDTGLRRCCLPGVW